MIRSMVVITSIIALTGCASGIPEDSIEHDDCVVQTVLGNQVYTSCGVFITPTGATFFPGREYDIVSSNGMITHFEDDTEFWKRTKKPTKTVTTTKTTTKPTSTRPTQKTSTKAPTMKITTRAIQPKPVKTR